MLVALTQAGLAATGGPSLDHARGIAARGQLEEALRESAACFDLGVEAEPAGAFHDRLQLGRVRQARDPRKAWEAAASLPFLTETGKEQARAHAMEVTIKAGAALQEKGEFAESALVIDSAPPELRQTGSLAGLRRRVYLEDALPLWKVIQSRRKSLEDRVTACNDITPHIQGLAALPIPLPILPDDASLMPGRSKRNARGFESSAWRRSSASGKPKLVRPNGRGGEKRPPGKRPGGDGPTPRSAAMMGRGRLRAFVENRPTEAAARGTAGWRGARWNIRSE